MRDKLKLFLVFLKLGLFTFGGGFAMIPQIKEVIIEKEKWMTESEMLEMIGIAESTPGPIAINLATYIGYKRGRFWGSIISTLGVVLPSLLIIFFISLFLDSIMENQYVGYAFNGIKCCVAFLICKAGIEMVIKTEKSFFNISILTIVFSLIIVFEFLAFSFSAIYIILIGGLLGIVFFRLFQKKKVEK